MESRIEYLRSGEYNPACEAGLSPVTADLDWSLCDAKLKGEFDALIANGAVVSKGPPGAVVDRVGRRPRAQHFRYGAL